MVSNLREETPWILLTQVPALAWIPTRRRGARLSVRTLFRWAGRGVSGVVLETTMCGGQRYTTVPALHRFFDAVATARRLKRSPAKAPAAARRDATEVEDELRRLGL